MRPNNEWTNKYVTQKNNDCSQNPTTGEVISALCATNGYFRGNAETWKREFSLDWVADQDKMILCVLLCLSVIPFCVLSQINRGRRTNSQPGQSTTFPGRASGSSKPDKNMDYEGILPNPVGLHSTHAFKQYLCALQYYMQYLILRLLRFFWWKLQKQRNQFSPWFAQSIWQLLQHTDRILWVEELALIRATAYVSLLFNPGSQ